MHRRLAGLHVTRRMPGLWPLVLVAALAAALVAPTPAFVRPPPGTSPAVERLEAVLAGLPDDPVVVLAFDPDIGTYPEIRTAVRTLLARLIGMPATIVMVSYTPEGRALAGAELGRLRAARANLDRTMLLGFVPGAEAGLVASVHELLPATAQGRVPDLVRRREAGTGLRAFDAAFVVGGNDLGPRSWVEQVGPRVPELPIVGVAPTFQQPELGPYLGSGQLAALLGTPDDLAAWAVRTDGARPELLGAVPARSLATLVGTLVAIGVLLRIVAAPILGRARTALGRARG